MIEIGAIVWKGDLVKVFEEAYRKAEEAVAAEMVALTLQGFDDETAPDGAAWKPRKSGGSWPLLNKTGRLKSSWQSRISGNAVKLSSNSPIAQYHQFGTKTIPARPMIPKNDADAQKWEEKLKETIEKALEEALS